MTQHPARPPFKVIGRARVRPVVPREQLGALMFLLVLGVQACSGTDGRTHWTVSQATHVEAFGRDTSSTVMLTLQSDSGPRGEHAGLRFICRVPADPTPGLMLEVEQELQRGDYGLLLARFRVDEGPITEENWVAPPEARSAVPFQQQPDQRYARIAALWHSRRLRLELPFDGDRRGFRFNTIGFDTAYTRIGQLCGNREGEGK